MAGALTQDERYPWLTQSSRLVLDWLREHPAAPRFNHECGDRLSAAGLARVRAFEQQVRAAQGWQPGAMPAWVAGFIEECFREVPFYRCYGGAPSRLQDVPTSTRADLSRAPWAFVPDTLPLEDLIVYNTSGATGQPLAVLSHPEAASNYLPLLEAALRLHGVTLAGGRDPATGRLGVALLLVCQQRRTYTYASVLSYLGGAGFAKINLNPDDWRDPADRAGYIDACRPEVFTGDPLSFAVLADLPVQHQPKALISTAMQLLPGLRQQLEARFQCPLIDLYAMHEAGPIAAATPAGHVLLQPRLYVEILDAGGRPCGPGERGEITLTGGFNAFLPLLRYRTGDFASLAWAGGWPALAGLEGRPPVTFHGAAGQAINNIDVTGALRPFALPAFQLHQAAGGGLRLAAPPASAAPEALRAALRELFGAAQAIDIVPLDTLGAGDHKVIQYTREAD